MRIRRSTGLAVLVWATLVSSPPVLGQFSQQGPKLVGTGAVGSALQGDAVSLSADGNTAIVGGIADNSNAGAVWVWTRSGGVWTQQGTKLVGSGAVGSAQQGFSVALSADGNTAIVGGIGDNGEIGAAWVWTQSGGIWTQQGAKLVGSGAVDVIPAQQGYSVALSADGNTAIVGGRRDNGTIGAAWVWTRSAGVWTQQGAKLVGSGGVGIADQGSSVSLSADGNTAVVGGPFDNSGIGAVWVWTRSGGVWTQQGPRLVGSGALGTPLQGFSVSLSADGNTAIVGGPFGNSGAGAAWVWTRSGGVWTQQGAKLVGSGSVGIADQGVSVWIAADAATAMVGGWADNSNAGAAWVFVAPVVVASADMSITKSVNGGPPFPAGANINYTISVVNSGPGAASSVAVTDVLPAGTAFVSATPSQGSCSGTTTVTCAVGALANGGSATISLVVTTALTPGVVSNTATVTAAEVDSNPANNSSSATINTINPSLIPVASWWVLMALSGVLALLGAMKIRATS